MGVFSHRRLAFATISVVAAVYVGSAQERVAELRLSSVRANGEYLLGEPVSVKILLTNSSTKPLGLLALLAPRYGELVLEISNDGRTFKKYLGPGWSTVDHYARPKLFRPGHQESEVVTILWNQPISGTVDHIETDLAFVQEGHYWLRAQLPDKEPIRQSNTLEIVMKNPAGDDAEVWKLLRNTPSLARYVQDPRPDTGRNYRLQLAEILRKYPRSSYAEYLRAATRVQQGDVQLRLEVTQTRFRVGEPVRVCTALVNRRLESVQFRPMSLLTQTMGYSIRSGDVGPFEKYSLSMAVDPQFPMDLAPGATYRAPQLIHFNYRTNGPAFPAPGRYTIRGEYTAYLSTKPLPASADVAIEITAPNAQEQAGAAVFSREATAAVLLGTSRDTRGINQLRDVASRTPPSVFGLYAKYYLALYSASRYGDGRMPDKPRDYPGAVRLMSEVNTPGFQLLPEVLLYLAQWSQQITDATAASRYVERLNREFPDSCAAFGARELQVSTAR